MRTPNKKLLLIAVLPSLEFINTEVMCYTLCTTGTLIVIILESNCGITTVFARYLFAGKIRFLKNVFDSNLTGFSTGMG